MIKTFMMCGSSTSPGHTALENQCGSGGERAGFCYHWHSLRDQLPSIFPERISQRHSCSLCSRCRERSQFLLWEILNILLLFSISYCYTICLCHSCVFIRQTLEADVAESVGPSYIKEERRNSQGVPILSRPQVCICIFDRHNLPLSILKHRGIEQRIFNSSKNCEGNTIAIL